MKGRIAVVTGATGAIGREIALGVARSGYTTLLTCRDEKRGKELVSSISAASQGGDVRLLLADFSSLASLAAMAGKLAADHPGGLHLLVNNAAAMEQSRVLTKDGLEMQFGVNVQAYFSLMVLLAPLLMAGAKVGGARVVNVASQYAGGMDLGDLQFERRPYDATSAYKQSKQADRMITTTAATNLFPSGCGVTVTACHPGVVTSKLLKGLGMSQGRNSASEGSETPLLLALDPSVAGVTGKYFVSKKETPCSFSSDAKACRGLWDACMAIHERVLGKCTK
mmetsp:Transcript_19852/g.38574  ORF Transcript_19852/g.38574 Transcript_19852/m.38574 type:complete len:281 (-) Transcript_19852:77-919(-)|eukprot:CAMPEP_0173413130 /NCGR_PEP_ID=MMETSP1356-20130122/81258_1 /TAXON_ID=77927 ORGANISM="Hemiselmis virescens, Strain PCC157" /NCGR_SAMPLE_ID=MMETSP1356 /ASSEMBLY_ACC=CAM_ASM_000847 /LENGTH=280 /DNA_ID=CAMNT_0014375123 /DNA_START=110 /DNA_END=952 /DNA_ORIENTATION=-